MRRGLRLFLLTSFGLFFSVLAHADTVSYSAMTGPLAIGVQYGTGSGVAEASLTQFDPTLGTLTSVSVSLSGPYTTSVPSPNGSSQLQVDLAANELFFITIQDEASSGTYNFTDSGSKSDASALQYFTGTSSTLVEASFIEVSNASDTSNGFNATVTYTFTPATIVQPVPEPGSLLLLGTGLVGLAGTTRRSWRRLSGSAI